MGLDGTGKRGKPDGMQHAPVWFWLVLELIWSSVFMVIIE